MSDNIVNLRKFVSPEIIFGSGARKMVGKYARTYGAKNVLIVTDPGVIEAGWVKDITASLEEVDISYSIFSKVSPNPRGYEVMTGAEFYREKFCDVIVAIGGGSPMDCAKGIGIVVSNGGDIFKFEGIDKIRIPVPPMIFIPTTAGTSADVSQFCIITNPDELVKIAIISKAIVPDVALVDPETTSTMSSYLTACTGIDALVHAIEAYVSLGSGPLTDMYALEAIRLIPENLPKLLRNPYDSEIREKVMLASMKAGLAFSNAILGAVHAMAHSLGGMLDLPHGECNAILLEHVIEFNYNTARDKYRRIAECFGLNTEGMDPTGIKKGLIRMVEELKIEAGIVNKLGNAGVKKDDIPALSAKASKDACIITNPRKASKRDIEVIYEEAL